MKNYYEILEVETTATLEQIKEQYLILINVWHPNNYSDSKTRTEAEEKIKDINEAYSVLSDPTKRAKYDQERLVERRQREAEEKARREMEQLLRQEVETITLRREAEITKMRQEVLEQARREMEQQAHWEAEERVRRENEELEMLESIERQSQKAENESIESEIKNILGALGKKHFQISVAYPKYLTKRFESPFLIQIYFEELASGVKAKIRAIIGENTEERIYDTELKLGQLVKVKLYSPDITFPEPITKKLSSPLNSMTFLGKPLDICQPGEHKVVLTIQSDKTGIEYQSETFTVKVIDFAFDHVSRPLLSRVSALILGIGSFAMFILTLLEQIDKTVGLTSGSAAGILALAVYAGFYNLYQRVRTSTP